MKKKELVGEVFGRLTVVSEAKIVPRKDTRAYWNCQCVCGGTIIVSTLRLTRENTQSCGCLKTEAMRRNQKLSLPSITKFHPRITSARRRWKSYLYQDDKCDLTFDQWFEIVQRECFYCGIIGYNTVNAFLKKKDASQRAKDNGNFSCNGLDRIDSSLAHTLDNVVSSCPICNRAKNDRTLSEFYQYIASLKPDNILIRPTSLLTLPTSYLLVSVKCAFRHYKRNYGYMELDLQTFYTYSQLPCYYCGEKGSNYYNVYLKDKKSSQNAKDGAHFYYNGVDRLDNSLAHNLENIVPCCYWCNFAKMELTLLEFQDWIKRVQNYQKMKSDLNDNLAQR